MSLRDSVPLVLRDGLVSYHASDVFGHVAAVRWTWHFLRVPELLCRLSAEHLSRNLSWVCDQHSRFAAAPWLDPDKMSTLANQLAHRMLADEGLQLIWKLHIDAATLHRVGNFTSAATFLEIADAADKEWLRQAGEMRRRGSARNQARSSRSPRESPS